jgi:hypothetical protein
MTVQVPCLTVCRSGELREVVPAVRLGVASAVVRAKRQETDNDKSQRETHHQPDGEDEHVSDATGTGVRDVEARVTIRQAKGLRPLIPGSADGGAEQLSHPERDRGRGDSDGELS